MGGGRDNLENIIRGGCKDAGKDNGWLAVVKMETVAYTLVKVE